MENQTIQRKYITEPHSLTQNVSVEECGGGSKRFDAMRFKHNDVNFDITCDGH